MNSSASASNSNYILYIPFGVGQTGNTQTIEHIKKPYQILCDELCQAEKDASEEDVILSKESVRDAYDFINNIFSKTELSKPYIDIHPDGQIAMVWHSAKVGVAGIAFDGKSHIIWTCYLEDKMQEKGTMKMSDFLSSSLHDIIRKYLMLV